MKRIVSRISSLQLYIWIKILLDVISAVIMLTLQQTTTASDVGQTCHLVLLKLISVIREEKTVYGKLKCRLFIAYML